MRFLLPFALALLAATAVARGQSTRPSANDPALVWEKQLDAIATAVAAHDSDALQPQLSASCFIHRFNADRDNDLTPLTNWIEQTAVLGDHAYAYPFDGLAQKIAQDVDSSPLVSESDKKKLDLGNDGAQAVALKWVHRELVLSRRNWLGVIVLWSVAGGSSDEPRPLFVLIKATRDGDHFRLASLVYGDALLQP
jgi:hypothetical protein